MSPQEILLLSVGGFGGIRIGDDIGNTANDGSEVNIGPFGLLRVHAADTVLSAQTTGNLTNITGWPLAVGDYGGYFDSVEVSGGDITAYKIPTRTRP